MKQQWAPPELIDHWTLTDPEKTVANQYHTDPNRIASALLLKFFQREGNFHSASKIFVVLLSNTLLSNFICKPQFLTPASGERERLKQRIGLGVDLPLRDVDHPPAKILDQGVFVFVDRQHAAELGNGERALLEPLVLLEQLINADRVDAVQPNVSTNPDAPHHAVDSATTTRAIWG